VNSQKQGAIRMTKEETVKLLRLIEIAYPMVIMKSEMVTRWFSFCQLLDHGMVLEKLNKHIRRNPYPPLLSEIASFPVNWKEQESDGERFGWFEEYSIRDT
jgi:hypothetical protein